VRTAGQFRQRAQRRAVAQHGQHRARGEVGPDADDLGRVDAGPLDRGGHGVPEHVDVVPRVLQGPVGRQRLAGGGQHLVHHAVLVLVGGAAQLGSVRHPDDQGPPGQRPEVNTDHVPLAGPAGRAGGIGPLVRHIGRIGFVSAHTHVLAHPLYLLTLQ